MGEYGKELGENGEVKRIWGVLDGRDIEEFLVI